MEKHYLGSNYTGKVHILGKDGRSLCGMLHERSIGINCIEAHDLEDLEKATCALCRKMFGLEAGGEREIIKACRAFIQTLLKENWIRAKSHREKAKFILQEMEKIVWLK